MCLAVRSVRSPAVRTICEHLDGAVHPSPVSLDGAEQFVYLDGAENAIESAI